VKYTGEEIQEKARRANHIACACYTCEGDLEFRVPDANSPGGRLTRPCSTCNEHGRVWYRRDLAPVPGRPRAIVAPLTDEALMELP